MVMLMHSFGAHVGCEALRGINNQGVEEAKISPTHPATQEKPTHPKKGKVVRLAFIAGLVLPVGKVALSKTRTETEMEGFVCEVRFS